MMMKRFISITLALMLALGTNYAFAEKTEGMNPPPDMQQGSMPPDGGLPDGMTSNGIPPDGTPPVGNPPDGMGTPPNGEGGPGGMGGFGGGSSKPDAYASVLEADEDLSLSDTQLESFGKDENALHVLAGYSVLEQMEIVRTSDDSTGGDVSSFYGVGAAVLTTGGTVTIDSSKITTDAAGGAGVFSYGDGVAYVTNTEIHTLQNTSGGIHVAGGGTLYATNLIVTTEGESAAAIRSDRGSGTMVVEGGSYTSNGTGSPAVYVTADISIANATLVSTGSEALCLEGLNAVRLTDSHLSGNMPDLSQNDTTWTVILYQSMSGDSQVGKGMFEMTGGTLTSQNGGLFYSTNTESEFYLSNVQIEAATDSEYFLRVTGNANQRGWGQSGANGANTIFTANNQQMNGNIIWDSISTLDFSLVENSALIGAVMQDESCAGSGGDGYCALTLDATSTWIVTGNSTLSSLDSSGIIKDENGNAVTVISSDGSELASGNSPYTITLLSAGK